MKRIPHRNGKAPVAWSDLAYAALQGNVTDTFEDRVTESLVDFEDEREAVDAVVHGTNRTLN